MARPTFARIGSPKAAFSWPTQALLCVLLLTSLIPTSLLPVELEFFAVTDWETFTPSMDDENDDPYDNTTHFLNSSAGTAAHLTMAHRRRLARALRFLTGNGRLENPLEAGLRHPPISSRAYPLPTLPGCEHSERNGLGAPLRC
ncbi:MAG TPA: hypothetical protein VH575_19910 [Gemmataceae bacterium]|jgi:hypothetical protein